MLDVANIMESTGNKGIILAQGMFTGVRGCGTEKLKTSFKWGYGR